MRGLTIGTSVLLIACLASRLAAAVQDPYDKSNVPIEQQPTDPSLAKIVLVAGDAGTGHPPGDHEHFAGCAMFYRMLKQTPGVWPVMVENGWPKDPKTTFENAKAVVFYMDGGGKQTTLLHEERVNKLAEAGVGIVHVHQCIDYPADKVPQAIKWLGGAYHPKTGARAHWDETFAVFPDHPVTRGLTPFKLINEGYITKLTFVDGMKGITPILACHNPKAKPTDKPSETDGVFFFVYERPDGGRSVVNTCGHGHKNWGEAGFRRLMVNSILWAAKVEVPAGGAKVDMDPADLMQNMEKKPPKAPATKPAAKPAVKPAAKPAA
jgi:type 1 glutamine amidotransferase